MIEPERPIPHIRRQNGAVRRQRGFSLIELLVSMAVVAILAAIAYPMYTSYVRKANRTAAKTALLEIASQEERYYSTNNVYATSLTMLGYSTTGIDVPTGGTPYYHVSFVTPPSATYFALQANPKGSQTQDTQCDTFTLNSLGQKGISGTPTPSGTATQCWQ